jgi:hypothetical protein
MVIANHKKGIIVFITQYMYESVTYYIIKGKEKNYLDKKIQVYQPIFSP